MDDLGLEDIPIPLALHCACRCAVACLLSENADATACTGAGIGALALAAHAGDVRMLLDAGASTEAALTDGTSAPMRAAIAI